MQENEYKQNYKVLFIKGLHKFFININRQFEIITKILFHAGFHYINRHDLLYILKKTPTTPLNSTKSAR